MPPPSYVESGYRWLIACWLRRGYCELKHYTGGWFYRRCAPEACCLSSLSFSLPKVLSCGVKETIRRRWKSLVRYTVYPMVGLARNGMDGGVEQGKGKRGACCKPTGQLTGQPPRWGHLRIAALHGPPAARLAAPLLKPPPVYPSASARN
jgi:hypothetical protein